MKTLLVFTHTGRIKGVFIDVTMVLKGFLDLTELEDALEYPNPCLFARF